MHRGVPSPLDPARPLHPPPNTFAPSECAKVFSFRKNGGAPIAERCAQDAGSALTFPFVRSAIKKCKLESYPAERPVFSQIIENNTGAFPDSPSCLRCHGIGWIMRWLTTGLTSRQGATLPPLRAPLTEAAGPWSAKASGGRGGAYS